jgi:hypothetical protein
LSGLSGLVKVLGVRTIRVTRVVKGIYITALEEDEVLQGSKKVLQECYKGVTRVFTSRLLKRMRCCRAVRGCRAVSTLKDKQEWGHTLTE